MKSKKLPTLKDLVWIFDEHEKERQEDNKRLLKKFKESNPGKKPPKWFTDDFSLPVALKVMCQEIQDIKGNWE